MKKITFLAKTMGLALFLLTGITASAQMELKIQTEMSTRFSQVNNEGRGVALYNYYDFASNQLTPLESGVFSALSINNNEDVGGMMFYDEPNFILQPAYRKDNIWEVIDFLPEQNPEQDSFDTWKISQNSKYITGQLSIGWNYAGFLFNTETEELTAAFDPEGEAGSFYSVNDNGIAVGWIDRPNSGGTLRVPAFRTLDGEFHFIPEGQLPENGVNTINDINNSDVMVGDFDLQPFIYDKATNTFTRFENPGGSFEAAFSSISENGVAVGFAEVSFQMRDAIIYHPSLGDQPIFIKDLLIDNGIAIDTDDGLLGTAISISPNGKYVAGWVNGAPPFAEGWMLYLDDIILGKNNITQTQISVYPNPVENILHIRASEQVDAIQIVNVLGQQITNVSIGADNKQIDVSDLASGVYMVKVTSNATQETFKIVKQ